MDEGLGSTLPNLSVIVYAPACSADCAACLWSIGSGYVILQLSCVVML